MRTPADCDAFFFFNDTATTEIYTLSLHDALPIFQVCQGLIQEKDLGIPHQGAAQGDALALPAGELARVAIEVSGDAEHLGGPPHLLLDLLAGRPARLEREGDVLEYGAVRVEGVALEHHGDPAGPGGHVAVHALVPDVDLARGGSLEPGDHAQQRRLPRAGGAEQDEEFAIANRQVHPVDRVEIPEVLSEASDFNASHRRGASSGAYARGPWCPAPSPGPPAGCK